MVDSTKYYFLRTYAREEGKSMQVLVRTFLRLCVIKVMIPDE